MITEGIRFTCDEFEDKFVGQNIKLSELLELIPKLQKKYGKHAILDFDAGYNNICVDVYPTKKQKG